MCNYESIINFALTVSNLVAVFKYLSYCANLKGVSLLNQALCKLPPNVRESWMMHTVKKHKYQPTLLHFSEWLSKKEKSTSALKSPKQEDRCCL